MKIPDHLEGQYKALIGLVLITLFIYLISREPKFSCDTWAKNIKDNKQLEMIYKESSDKSRDMTLYGWDLKNHLKTEYNDDGSGWLSRVIDTLRRGDTITKVKGEYNIKVRRKNLAFSIPIVCDKVYTDTPKNR